MSEKNNMKVLDAINETLTIWDESKYGDYIRGNNGLDMNLLFKMREDILNRPKQYIELFNLDENDFEKYDMEYSNKNDGCEYTFGEIVNKNQTIKCGLYDTTQQKKIGDIECKIECEEDLRKVFNFIEIRGKSGKYKYIYVNEFDHWISYLIVKYLVQKYYVDKYSTIQPSEAGLKKIQEEIQKAV